MTISEKVGDVDFELISKCADFEDLKNVNGEVIQMADTVDKLEQDTAQLSAMLQAANVNSAQQQAPRVFDITGQIEHLATTACSTWDGRCVHRHPTRGLHSCQEARCQAGRAQ